MFATTLLLSASLLAQPAGAAGRPDEAMAFMKGVASSYQFATEGGRPGPLTLAADPAFRLGKQPADDVLDGAIFFWSGPEGRPEAALQVFRVGDATPEGGHWVQEFISLSPGTFAARRDGKPSWAPRTPGVEFKAVPGAAKVADSPAQRARQMRALAQEFRVSDHFKDKPWSELRLLTTPVARYGRAGSGVLDGALFAFAEGTDPEAFVFLEAREGPSGPEWHYALAPMSCFELKGSLQGQVVWTSPRRKDAYDPAGVYFVRLD